MLFLYGELLVLLLVSFGVGAVAATVVTRVLVKPLPPELSLVPAGAANGAATGAAAVGGAVDGGGTP